jgi:hypothetical protein
MQRDNHKKEKTGPRSGQAQGHARFDLIHHYKPLVDGGKDVYENILTVHPDADGALHIDDFKRCGSRGRGE